MARNLDTSLLRAFVTVAETSSMTVAANALHLTQAAISQQVKRLEDTFACSLFERDRRGIKLTNDGERLFGKAKRLLGVNDEIWADMTTPAFKGQVRLGVPYDLVGNYMPPILKAYASSYPQVEISLVCLTSPQLKEGLAAGELDVVIAEEPLGSSRGECLATDRLLWVGAKGGDAYMKRPLPISFGCDTCAFRPVIFDALRTSGMPWRTVSEIGNAEAISATVQIDLAVSALLATTIPPGLDILTPHAGLPPLPNFSINLHLPKTGSSAIAQALASTIRDGFCSRQRQAA